MSALRRAGLYPPDWIGVAAAGRTTVNRHQLLKDILAATSQAAGPSPATVSLSFRAVNPRYGMAECGLFGGVCGLREFTGGIRLQSGKTSNHQAHNTSSCGSRCDSTRTVGNDRRANRKLNRPSPPSQPPGGHVNRRCPARHPVGMHRAP